MFKLRTPGAANSGAVQPPTIEAVRKRARHRLIGASVLVLAGVIGLPLLFDKQPRPIPVDFPIDLPAKQVAKPAPLAETAPPPAVKVEGLDAKEEVLSTSQSSPSTPVAQPALVAQSEPAPKAEPVTEPTQKPEKPDESAKPTVRIVVQVGAFADANRAREARSKLEKAGLKTYTHVAETPEGKRIRVRAGPFATKAEADKAALKAKSVGLPAAILTL